MELVNPAGNPVSSVPPILKSSWTTFGAEQGVDGVEFDVWAHPNIEGYFKQSAIDRLDPIELIGHKVWFSGHGNEEARKNAPKLVMARMNDRMIYDMQGRSDYTFAYPGYGLDNAEIGISPQTVNLSFLRIQGISQGGGVKFGVKGVMSNPAIRDLQARTKQAIRSFIKDYLVPVRFEFEITSRETRK